MEASEPRQRRNAAVVAQLAIKDGEKIVDQPAEKRQKKPPRRKISFDVGSVPVHLKSVLKKQSTSEKLAKQIQKKYRSRRVQFQKKCHIAVISPLPGWSATKLRLPESDEEEEDPENGANKARKKLSYNMPRLKTHLQITPNSMRKLEIVAFDLDANRVDFNAAMVFGDEGESSIEEQKDKKRAKKARRVTIAKLKHEEVPVDSPEPVRPISPGAIARRASLGDPNLEDSSQATSVEEEPLEAPKTANGLIDDVTGEIRKKKAARAEDWLNDEAAFIEQSHDSTLEREQELFELASAVIKGKEMSSSSEKLDGDVDSDVVVEEPPPTARSKRRSLAPKAEKKKSARKNADEPPPKSLSPSENVAPTKEPVNTFFLPRNSKKASSDESSKDSGANSEKKNKRRSVFIKEVAEVLPFPPAPIEPPTESKAKSSRRKSFFVQAVANPSPPATIETPVEPKAKSSRRKSFFVQAVPEIVVADEVKSSETTSDEKKVRFSSRRKSIFAPKEPIVAKKPEPIDDIEILEAPSQPAVVKPRPQKRKSMFVPTKAKKAAVLEEDDEEENASKKEDKQWKRAVHWNELDYAPVPKLHSSEAIRFVEEAEVESLPSPSYRVRLPPKALPPLPGPFPIEMKDDPLPRIPFTVLSNTENIERSLDDREKEWLSLLRRECDASLPWTEAFSPKVSGFWFGDATVAAEARNFVAKWRKRVVREEKAEKMKQKKEAKKRKGDDSDDSDYNGEDDGPMELDNPLILCGPTGSGKTALISALASELNMKILEVQPGDRRNGAALRQKLAEAGKSHLMQTGPSIASFFGGGIAPSAALSQPKQRKQTLIVVEHVDIYFEEDKEFWATLKSLAAEAKVPVIWTCERFPETELRREPELGSYAKIDIGYSPERTVARYVKCCLLATKKIDVTLEDLERFVLAHNCDLRSILINLQIQLASPEDNFIELPAKRSLEVTANVTEITSGYSSWEEQLEEKRLQYREIVTEVEGIRRDEDAKMRARLAWARQALNRAVLVRTLAVETMPFLVTMDAAEMERASNHRKRRFQHYFDSVRSEHGSIDTNGALRPNVKFFSFPPLPPPPPPAV